MSAPLQIGRGGWGGALPRVVPSQQSTGRANDHAAAPLILCIEIQADRTPRNGWTQARGISGSWLEDADAERAGCDRAHQCLAPSFTQPQRRNAPQISLA